MICLRDWRYCIDNELRVFSTFNIKKIRSFVNKGGFYYDKNYSSDFALMRMVCTRIISIHCYTADIHVLIWAVIWLSQNGCKVPKSDLPRDLLDI